VQNCTRSKSAEPANARRPRCRECPLWVKSGHLAVQLACPLYPRGHSAWVDLGLRSPGESPAVSANPLPINSCDFLRNVTAISACHRPNRRNRLSFPKCLYLFRHHASRLGSGQSTAGGNAHQTKCYGALRLKCQHGRLRRYGKPVVPDSKQVAHCAFPIRRHISRARFLPDEKGNPLGSITIRSP
jgi:hypothetical protein